MISQQGVILGFSVPLVWNTGFSTSFKYFIVLEKRHVLIIVGSSLSNNGPMVL